MVHKQFNESVQVNVSSGTSLIAHSALSNFINHALNFVFSRVIAHSAHQVGKLFNWHVLVQFTSLGSVLNLSFDHSIVEEILHVLVCLTFEATLNQVDEGVNTLTAHRNSLVDGAHVDSPHVDCQVISTAGEHPFTIVRRANVSDLLRMRNETHSIMRVSVKRKFDQANNLLFSCVAQELFTIESINLLKFCDLATVGGTKASAASSHGCRVPKLDFVLVVGGKENAFFEVEGGVPDAASGLSFHLNDELAEHGQGRVVTGVAHIVLEATSIFANREESLLNLVILINRFTE